MEQTGVVFDIQKFSIHDGYGIRTTVFLKGCNNRCLWCHNPESLSMRPQLQFTASRCIGCGACARVCKHGVFSPDGSLLADRCVHCGDCAEVCCTKARQIIGKTMTVDEVFAQIEADRDFYNNTGGGVTFSGGEPMLQADFVAAVAKKCREAGIDVCIQTACNVPYSEFEKVLPYTDTMMCDFKVFDDTLHQKYVGVSNVRIMENLQRLASENVRLIVRTPIVGGVNDTSEEVEQISRFIQPFANLDYYELLRYHAYGLGKLEGLQMSFGQEFEVPTEEQMKQLTDIAKQYIPRVKSCVSELEPAGSSLGE